MDPENISHNASDYEQNLSSASPTIPPSDNELEFGINKRRPYNHHHLLHHRRASISEKLENENESDSVHRDDLDGISDRVAIRAELSPIQSGDQSRKRRKDSSCDNLLSLPHKRHQRNPSESLVSISRCSHWGLIASLTCEQPQ